MIRKISIKDKTSVVPFFSSKLNISLHDATLKLMKILKSGNVALILESRDLQGICWIETRIVNDKKTQFIEIFVNNWRLAESFIKVLRWNLNGIYWFSLPRHDFLNRTLNKNGIRFMYVEGDKNIYCYKFEKRDFFNYKNEDTDEN